DDLRQRARAVLSDPEIGAAVVAESPRPTIDGQYRGEPTLGPRLIVLRQVDLDEIGGVPEGNQPLPEILSCLRLAGHRLGLVPVPVLDAPTRPDRVIER